MPVCRAKFIEYICSLIYHDNLTRLTEFVESIDCDYDIDWIYEPNWIFLITDTFTRVDNTKFIPGGRKLRQNADAIETYVTKTWLMC